ncbi:MAG: AzlC family ABC transporter permease [Tissierellia bacterium]|nr:AzlC family ABC transporter permease [Tissierellia bacterium]
MTIKLALKNMVPLLFSYLFVGIAFGLLVVETGYPPYYAPLCAIFIYAGSMQIVLISLLQSHMPLWLLAAMTFFVNARHIFYGFGFLQEFKAMGWKYPIMVFGITDETYSIFCSMKLPKGVNRDNVRFYITVFAYFLWLIACTIGAYFGDILPSSLNGIDYSAIAFFITVVANQWEQLPTRTPIYIGFFTGIFGLLLTQSDKFLLPAFCFSAALLIIFQKNIKKVTQ